MIGGTIKPTHLSVEEILQQTSGGYDIFMLYEGRVKPSMKRPWGRDDSPSWGIFLYNGLWFWKDLATEESGTAVEYVKRKFGLTLKQAKERICWDFNLNGGRNIVTKVVQWQAPETEEKEYIHLEFTPQPFQKKHHEFWNKAGVSEPHCNKYECWAVKDYTRGNRKIRIPEEEIVFGYYEPTTQSCKLYFPMRKGQNRFRTNTPYHTLWNAHNMEAEQERLLINKSNKDMIVAALFLPEVVCTTSEAVKIFNDEVVESISIISDNVFVGYGSDEDGRAKSAKLHTLFGYKELYPDESLLPQINDFYSLACNKGVEAVEQLFKQKELI